ncbi:MAG TPA: ATP-binding cassette domain-containing protein [Bryobacteraceae bacterium]|nr:ATP-binding cassette domain-containing protein [Bryobacteraceae bacterium]
MTNPPLAIAGLHKSFGSQKVLSGVNLSAAAGETVVVLGRSGTGKSVLLKLIVGLHKPDAGSIRIFDQEINRLGMDAMNELRKKIGFLFQQAALYDSLTVEENVAFPLERHSRLSEAERRGKVRELLASVGMERDLAKMPSDISGGMQKRVGLARALALDPDILLFDEPTSGLDPITAAEIGQLIVKLRKERDLASIVVTHDVHGAKSFADRVVMLREGKVVIDGTFTDMEQSKDPFVVEFLKDAA